MRLSSAVKNNMMRKSQRGFSEQV